MSQNRAELIFIAGPQQGQRSLLMTASVVIGRHPSCDIQITEQTVSRQQARFRLSPHGWVVGSLASSAIRVNTRRYKASQQIILETGDILGVGIETEMLFVAQGDDVEAALAEMREAHPQFAGFTVMAPVEAPTDQVPMPPTPPVERPDAFAPPVPVPEPEPLDLIVSDRDEALAVEAAETEKERKAKLRKYVVGFGLYGVLFLGFIIAMSLRPTEDTVDGVKLERLPDREIEKILTKDLDIPERPRYAEDALDKARRHYDDFPQQPDAMYKAVKQFKIYLKFTGMQGFQKAENQTLYRNAKNTLVDSVTEVYHRAWKEFKNEDWDASLRDFQEVLRMIPVQDEPYPDKDNKLFLNVRRHIRFIRDKTASKPQRRF